MGSALEPPTQQVLGVLWVGGSSGWGHRMLTGLWVNGRGTEGN